MARPAVGAPRTARDPGSAAARALTTAGAMACTLALLLWPRAEAAAERGATIGFTASQSGTPLTGRFDGFQVQLNLDPARPHDGAVHVQVDTATVDAGAPQTNALLRSSGFFDSAQFAQARFDASDFSDQGGGRFLARGTFRLKNHTAALPVAFTAVAGAQGLVVEGEFTISRLAFTVGEGEWADTGTLDDAVVVRFHLLGPAPHPGGAR